MSKCTKIRKEPIAGLSEREEGRLLAAGMEEEKIKELREVGMSAAEARKLAQKVADAWESAMKKSWTVTHIRRVMSDLTFDVAGDDLVVPSVRGWFEEYISGLSRRGKAMATV